MGMRPYWDEDPLVSSWPGLASLDGDVSADVCVVGLGGSGLAAAAEALDRGLSVVGLDAGRIAAGAAGRNGGFLVAGPEEPLHKAIALWGEDAAVALYRDTLAEIDRLADLLGPEVIRRVGSIRLAGIPGEPESEREAADRERELADCDLQAETLRAHGLAVEEYEGPLGSGLFLPDDAATNPARRALGLAAGLDAARLFEQTRVTAVSAGRVVTPSGTVSAGAVVVAVDGRLEVLLPQLAGRVRTARLQMAATDPVPPGRLPCPVYGRWGYDYAQQSADGVICVGGGRDVFEAQEWTTDDEPTAFVQGYIADLADRFAGEPAAITHHWAASVGFTGDGRPLCTLVDDGVAAAGGYNGTGNLVGPIAARAALALALDGATPPSYLQT
jgi:glycine/D-amino acid oxidase-like deaminating enzyme